MGCSASCLTGQAHCRAARLLLSVAGAIGALSGCSDGRPATYPVEGQVVLEDGTPVASGTVEFESVASGINARGEIQRDGRFRLSTFESGDGAVAGRHRAVVVQVLIAQGERAIQHNHAPGAPAARPVHPRYARYETSGLGFDVSGDRRNVLTVTVQAVE